MEQDKRIEEREGEYTRLVAEQKQLLNEKRELENEKHKRKESKGRMKNDGSVSKTKTKVDVDRRTNQLMEQLGRNVNVDLRAVPLHTHQEFK